MSTREVAAAYDAAVDGWRNGPEAVYGRLASALLDTVDRPLTGARVLDVGAGTAVAGRAALAAGARTVVATDIAISLLRHRGTGLIAVCADAALLPFGDRSFDLVTAAFCLGHLPDPVAALTESRRVAGAVVASTFEPGWTHPAKALVDDLMAEYGYAVPDWYRTVKEEREPAVNGAAALQDLARRAGFEHVVVERVVVDAGLRSPAEVVDWRLGMAHLAPFVAGLSGPVRAEARRRAEAALAGAGPVDIPMLALNAS